MLSSEVQELIKNKEWKKNIVGEDFKVDMVINPKSKERIKVKISLTNGDIIEYIGYEVIDYINFEMQFIQYWRMCDGKYKVENNIIVLETELYWKFYKTFNKGKDFLKYNWIINGKECRFMTTKEMFDNNKRGIYGIYYNGELIYIGSASDYIERWKQHEEEFNSPYLKILKNYILNYYSLSTIQKEKLNLILLKLVIFIKRSLMREK